MSLRHIVALLALLAAACATPPTAEKPAPVTPQITEDVLRARASEQLLTGIRQYESRCYRATRIPPVLFSAALS